MFLWAANCSFALNLPEFAQQIRLRITESQISEKNQYIFHRR
jgi:hypothetical protein